MMLSRQQVREIDRRATVEYGIPSLTLMENAGRGCAELMMRLNPAKKSVVILCGPGNNGGDGFVMARHLHAAGWPTEVILIGDPAKLQGDAAIACAEYQREASLATTLSAQPDVWYVDALFGTGLSRPLQGEYARLVESLNAFGRPILAIDIPSGLDCDTGEPLGVCVKATHTATFVAPKLGFQNPISKQFTGEVHGIDLGVPQSLLAEYS